MKFILDSLKMFAAVALLALAAGCASDAINKENLAIAAGFKMINPVKPGQQAIIAKLPKDKVSLITYNNMNYYVLPDAMNNVAYVGGLQEYRAYQQLRIAKQLSNQNLEAAQMNQMDEADWGGWGGWGGPAFIGFR